MQIARQDLCRDLTRLEDKMDRYWPFKKEDPFAWTPRTDIKETDKQITARMDFSSMKVDGVNVSIDKDIVTISCERKIKKQKKGEDSASIERSLGSFGRSFYLGIPVKVKEAKTSYKDEVLEVSIIKIEARKAKKIKVRGGK